MNGVQRLIAVVHVKRLESWDARMLEGLEAIKSSWLTALC